MRQAVITDLEQEPVRDMVSVGRQGAGADLVITVKATAGGIELAEQVRQAGDQLGVPAGLIVPAGAGNAELQSSEIG